jgi:hypothetical protein
VPLCLQKRTPFNRTHHIIFSLQLIPTTGKDPTGNTATSVTVVKMSNDSQKTGGKEDDEEGHKREMSVERGPSALATVLHDVHLSSRSPPAQNQQVSQQSAAASGPATLPQSTNEVIEAPLAARQKIEAILASPASSFTACNPRDLMKVVLPPICHVCCNFDPYEAPSHTERQRTWATKEFNIPVGAPMGRIEIEKWKNYSNQLSVDVSIARWFA